MKKILFRLHQAIKTALHLGFSQVFWYAIYQLGLRSGHFRRAGPVGVYPVLSIPLQSPYQLPRREQLILLLGMRYGLAGDLTAEADEICAGQVRLFGGPPATLDLKPVYAGRHWTDYEGHPESAGVEDFKLIWEPARFGWAYPLGRAYLLTLDERYPAAFWTNLDVFCSANLPNQGPNWSSAQEVALRLLALLFAASVFEQSLHTTPSRREQLAGVIAAHAQRIPPTLSYACAQNNNHLITEALGLLAAGASLPDHPQAEHWRKLGRRWINYALQKQIHPNGVYAQHSMNYHRLMLHAALQAQLVEQSLPQETCQRLSAATTWLLAQVDPTSGRAPNLGSNDGAHILPLASGGFGDYRPVTQAAARAFLGQSALPPGPWDELCLWLGLDLNPALTLPPLPTCRSVLRLGNPSGWATLRAAHFRERPAHADQMHVDLWWRGENIALDAGTFRYTAHAPWDNALAETPVHNTITVNGQNQMQRAGRFLWLDWAQAHPIDLHEPHADTLAAEHNGYARLGILHRRILKQVSPDSWQVTDMLLPKRRFHLHRHSAAIPSVTIHWLLPDWPWNLDNTVLLFSHPTAGKIRLAISSYPTTAMLYGQDSLSLVRAGKCLVGSEPVSSISGWCSPTYNQKIPALSFSVTFHSTLPLSIVSDWTFAERDGIF